MTPHSSGTPADALRRLYNSIDKIFDRGALEKEERFTRSGLTTSGALTMGAVYALCQNIAQEFEFRPCLTMIAAPEGTDRMGMALRWEFFFDLPKRRARLECAWTMREDGQDAQIDVTARPFPPADSPLRKQVEAGQLLRRQLAGMWLSERGRRPCLPRRFYNSDQAMIKIVQQGFDPAKEEFNLTAKFTDGGQACWVLQAREKTYQVPFGLDPALNS